MTTTNASLQLIEREEGKILELHVSGKIEKVDYDRFVPEVERLIKLHGKVRMLVLLADFHGWSMSALWEDIKFDVRHFRDIDRLALVGDRMWQKGMAVFCKPFTTAEVRYFDHAQLDEAREWIGERQES